MTRLRISKSCFLWAVRLALPMSVALSAVAAEQQTRSATQPAGTRVLHSPASNRTVGFLKAYSPGDPPRWGLSPADLQEYALRYENSGVSHPLWQLVGPIRGGVAAPSGKRLSLDIWEPATRNPSFLSKLAPDDLYALRFENPWTSKIEPGDAILPHITRLTGLRCLDIGHTKVTAGGLKQLTKLKNLERLTVPYGTTEEGVAMVTHLPNLKALCLSSGRVTNASLGLLANISTLEELYIAGQFTDAGMAHLTKLPRLRLLQIGGCDITDAAMNHIARIPSLRFLNIAGHDIGDAGLAELAKASQLEGLDLYRTLVTDDGLAHLKPLRSLKTLTLVSGRDPPRVRISDRGLVHLAEIKSLEYLDVPLLIKDEALAHVARLPHLAHLHTRDYCSDADLERIGAMQSLQSLEVGGEQITNAGLAHLAKLRNLQDLTIKARLDDQSLATLARLTSLKYLKLLNMNNRPYAKGPPFTITGLNQLNTLTNLVVLEVYSVVRQDGAGLNLSGLKAMETMEFHTYPEEPRFTDRDAGTISELKALRTLTLDGDLTDKGVAYLAGLPNLSMLTTGGPGVTDRGLAELSKCSQLTRLTIKGKFTDKGLATLEDYPVLTSLYSDMKPFSAAAIARIKSKRPDLHLPPSPDKAAGANPGKAPAKR